MDDPTTPWEQLPNVWKNENQFWNYIRGALRKAWTNHPVKLEFIKKYRIKVPNPNPNGRIKEVFGMECARCLGKFPMHPGKATKARIEKLTGKPLNYIEINHKKQAGRLRTKKDFAIFAANLLIVVFKDLEPLCNNCHKVVSYSQKFNMSEVDAEIELEVVQVCKLKAYEVKRWLEDNEVTPDSNAEKRKKQIRDIIRRRYEQR